MKPYVAETPVGLKRAYHIVSRLYLIWKSDNNCGNCGISEIVEFFENQRNIYYGRFA